MIESIPNWADWLSTRENPGDMDFIRARTRTGRPCSSDEFARSLEARFGVCLLPRKRGPQTKKHKEGVEVQADQKSFGFE